MMFSLSASSLSLKSDTSSVITRIMSLNKGININKPVLSQIIFISTQRSLDICQSSDSSEESVRMSPVVDRGGRRDKSLVRLAMAGWWWRTSLLFTSGSASL